MKLLKLTLAAFAAALITAACSGNANNKNEGTESDSILTEAATNDEAEIAAAAGFNKELFGFFSGGDPDIMLQLHPIKGEYDGYKDCYGMFLIANEFFEYYFALVVTNITPDGDAIQADFDMIELGWTGTPDNYDDEETEVEVVQTYKGCGTMTITPVGDGQVKISTGEKHVNGAVLTKIEE